MFCRKCGNQLNEVAAFCGKCGERVSSSNAHNAQATQQPRTQEVFLADSEKYTSKKKPKRIKIIVGTAMVALLAIAGVAFANQSGAGNVPFLSNSKNSVWVVTECSSFLNEELVDNAKLEYDDSGNCTNIEYYHGFRGFNKGIEDVPGLDIFFDYFDGKNSRNERVYSNAEFTSVYEGSSSSFKVENDYDEDGALTSGRYIAGGISLLFDVNATKNEKGCVTSYSVSPSGEAVNIVSNPTASSVISYKYDFDQETILEVSDNSEHLFSLKILDNGITATRNNVDMTFQSIFGSDNKPTSLSYKVPSFDYNGTDPVESDENGNISKISVGDGAYTFSYKRIDNPSVNARAFARLLENFLSPRPN